MSLNSLGNGSLTFNLTFKKIYPTFKTWHQYMYCKRLLSYIKKLQNLKKGQTVNRIIHQEIKKVCGKESNAFDHEVIKC